MALTQETCVPCQGGVDPLTEAEAQAKLAETPGWALTDHGHWLHRRFEFKNWKQVFAFVGKVSEIAEAEGHHPDVEFGWGYCEIHLQTHKIGGLHHNDFIVAAKIGALAA